MQATTLPAMWTSYLRWMLYTCVLAIATVGAFNAFMDPLGVFNFPRVVGVNSIKPYLDHHRELTRYENSRRVCADTGFFGNSRAGIGFDPESPALAARGLQAYNHAIPGTGARTTYQQLLWLQATGCLPKTAFIGVDFFDFLGGALPRALPTLDTIPAPKKDMRFFAESVFSIAGLRDSLSTLLVQRLKFPAIVTDHGFNPLLNYIPEIAQNGHYAMFRQRAEDNVRSLKRKPLRLRPDQGGRSDDEAVTEASLARLASAGSTTYVIIYPYHAQIRLLIERLGMGELFSAWKRLIFEIAMHQSTKDGVVEVWDFSGISPETLEEIPIKGDYKTQLKYFWEAGHFKKELGDLVMARVQGMPGNFGIKLNPSTLESWLAEDRRRMDEIRDTPSHLLAEVNNVIATQTEK
jgi:hypothetical protein